MAVVSNGTAVLGLGDLGPLAGKPGMEGKGVLFNRFADISPNIVIVNFVNKHIGDRRAAKELAGVDSAEVIVCRSHKDKISSSRARTGALD